MNPFPPAGTQQVIESLYVRERAGVLASLIRILGDFDIAEDATQEAFRAASQAWATSGIPDRPRSWLVAVGRNRGVDMIRQRSRQVSLGDLDLANPTEEPLEDDILRLIFACCHPLLPEPAQVALVLREVCGLTTEEIAHAFLSSTTTIAQRIVRAKATIRDRKIPYEVPATNQLPERLSPVLRVIYLVFNEGYYASSGATLMRPRLAREAIELGRSLVDRLPDPEALGLLALMLFHESRRSARTDADGNPILMPDQDRSQWDSALIAEGSDLVQRAFRTGRLGAYVLQAAIAAVHAQSPSDAETDWVQICRLYDLLLDSSPSPVVALNRTVAVSKVHGAQAALDAISPEMEKTLSSYSLLHATRAEYLTQLDRPAEARSALEKALSLTESEVEQKFLRAKLDALSK